MKTYDPKCYDLARAFLETGAESEVHELASSIQSTIEWFLEDRELRVRHPEAFKASPLTSQERKATP